MLEACPEGSRICRVHGAAFCVVHEADEPCVKRALAAGYEVRDLNGAVIEWPRNVEDERHG